MKATAWAIEIEPANYQVILSEGGRSINKDFLERWLEKYSDGGYFVRDVESSRFDCTLMSVNNFFTLYRFVEKPFCEGETDKGETCNGAHFREIEKQEQPALKAG